jgi:hypothetical protein
LAGWFIVALLALSGAATLAWADGSVDGAIGAAVGTTGAIDADDDGWCQNTSARGDIIDFHAYNDANNRWNFAFVIDSSQGLDANASGFFGDTANNRVDYFIPIDVGANNTPQLYFNSAPNWGRAFGVTGDYFIRCQSTGASSLSCGLYNSSGADTGASISVTSLVVDYRRHIELQVTNDNGTGVNANSAIGAMVIAAYDPRDASSPYYSLDAAGANSPEGMAGNSASATCSGEFVYRDYTDNNVVTAANCGGRQCTSLPTRSTFTALTGTTCAGEQGVDIDGNVNGSNEGYTFLSEAAFAGPYQGGSTTTSDFVGESAATVYYTGVAYASRVKNNLSGVTADLQYANARAGTCFFYLQVEGPSAVNSGGSDLANLFIAIDRDGGSATNLAAPAGRAVDFSGWQPDYVVELVWQGDTSTAGNLYTRSGASWTSVAFPRLAAAANTGALYNASDCASLDAGDILYFNDTSVKGFEFAIPWTLLGGKPASSTQLRLGAYTTTNDSGFDVYDQAPGVGQGCSGLGCHERIGDEPHDVDSGSTGGDLTPYAGRTIGDDGDAPGSDPFSDVDTIEEYFVFTPGANVDCPLALGLRSFAAQRAAPWALPLGLATGALALAAAAARKTRRPARR